MCRKAFVQISGRSLFAWYFDPHCNVAWRVRKAFPDDADGRGRLEASEATERYPRASTRQKTVRKLFEKLDEFLNDHFCL